MARLIFPDDQVVLRPGPPNATIRNAAGATAVVYVNTTGTLADITQLDGTPIPTATLTVDTYSRLPLFYGPDAIDTLYVSVDSGPLTAIYARVDDRLDALQTQLDNLNATVSGLGAGGGPVTASGTVTINGTAGTTREVAYYSGANKRWSVRANNSAESGSNAGSDWAVARYDDAGSFIDEALTVERSTGRVKMSYLDVLVNALGIPTPANHGLVAWTYDPGTTYYYSQPASGQVVLSALWVPRNVTVTKLIWSLEISGTSPTSGRNFVGLYNSSGTRLASVGVDAKVTTTGVFTETIGVSLTPGRYWVAWLFNATSTPLITANESVAHNAGITSAASYRAALGPSGQTSLPASITVGSLTSSTTCGWAAIG